MQKKEIKYAGFSTRLLAHNIDLIPILLLLYFASFILPNNEYDLFLYSGIYLFYYSCFEASPWQATPGKKWVKLKVVDLEKKKAKFHKIVIRNIFKSISLLAIFGGFVMIIFHKKRQGLHDFIGGTMVLFDED